MKKKVLATLLAATMVFSLAACGGKKDEGKQATAGTIKTEEKAESNGMTIGVCMPTQSSERWINDGNNMQAILEAKGYEVKKQFAEDDPAEQVKQIENMISQQVDAIVIAAVDGDSLAAVCDQAKQNDIPVIAYDRLIKNTDAISYYATFDNKGVGTKIGEYIRDKKELDKAREAKESYTIEFFNGSPDDNNAHMLAEGIMEVLQPYLDDGTLVCKTGRTSFNDTCILRWSQETAQQWCENYLSSQYADEKLDIACSAFDGFSYGIKAALAGAGYTEEDWPMVTGQDAELMAVKNIIGGTQTMSISKDTRKLAEVAATMVDAVCQGKEPEVNNTETYDNGKLVVPTYECEPVPVDQDNYKEVLIDTEYYTEDQLK